MALPLLGLGSMLANIGRVGKAGVGAYRTMQGIRAARAAEGIPMGYQRVLGTTGTGLGSGTSGTGLQGLMARGAKKYPGASGSLEAGTGVLLGGEGVGDIMEGYQEGDIGQLAMGLGSLALGTPLASRGLRLAGSSRKLPQGAREAMRTTGKEFSARIPRGTTAVGLGGIGTGLVLGDETPATQGEPQVISQNPVDIVIKAIEYDKANPKEAKEKLGYDVSSPEYKKLAQEQLTKAYQEADKLKIKPTQTIDEVSKVFQFGDSGVINTAKIPNTEKGQLTNSPMKPDEINAVAKSQEAEVKAGQKLKNKLLSKADSAEAEQFNNFYSRIQNLTGGNDNTNDLILMKLASGLMTGKSSQKGIRGFLDVLGQAGGETTDTAIALYSKERDRRNDLAVAYLKSKEKEKNNYAVTGKRQRVVVTDQENGLFGLNSFDKDVFKDDGRDAIAIPEYNAAGEMVGTQWVPMKYTQYTEVKPSAPREAKDRTRLSSIALGWKMAQEVDKLPTSAMGFRGKFSSTAEDFFGFMSGVAETAGFEGIDEVGGTIDAKIVNDIINAPVFDAENNIVAASKEQAEKSAKVAEMYRKETSKLFEDLRSDDKNLSNIARAKLIQTRMKYILANANKAEDRLTVADVNNAAENTQILKFFSSPAQIKRQYKQLAKELESQFKVVGASYIQGGGTPTYILSQFQYMPSVAEYIDKQSRKQLKGNVQQNLSNTIASIE
jgi:hypothetical protein